MWTLRQGASIRMTRGGNLPGQRTLSVLRHADLGRGPADTTSMVTMRLTDDAVLGEILLPAR